MESPFDQQNLSCGSEDLQSIDGSTDPPLMSSCSGRLSLLLLQYTIGSLLIFIIFLSISGNILVCIAIYTDRRLRKLGNLFLVSLALADLFLAALVMTFAVANDMMGYWVFGSWFCEIWIAFDVMCCTASILNLCAISLDRFFHIKDPLRYERWMTKKVILTSLTGIWLLSALVSFVPISFGWHRPAAAGDSISSSNITSELKIPAGSTGSSSRSLLVLVGDSELGSVSDYQLQTVSEERSQQRLAQCSLDLTPVYAVVSSSISFYIPCLIMIALYTRLYLYAKKHVRNIRSVTKSLQFDQEKNLTGSSDANYHHSKQYHASEHKAAITLGVIMGTFLFCWVPFFIANIIDAFCKTCIPAPLFKILTWLGYFNSAMNPVIYSIFNTEFRDAFRKILISYARNECCDGRRDSRGATDPLVVNRTTRYSTSDAGQQQQHHLQPAAVPGVPSRPSSQSLNHHPHQGREAASTKQYNSITSNHSSRGAPSIEVMQDKSIELTFFPTGSTMDLKNQISAI